MKYWNFSINSLHRTGKVHVESVPFWLWFFDLVLGHVVIPSFDLLRYVKIPDVISPTYDDLSLVLFNYVCSPLVQWSFDHPSRKRWIVDLGYDKVRDMFYEDYSEFFDYHEQLDA